MKNATRFLSLLAALLLSLLPAAALGETPQEPQNVIQIISENSKLDLTPYAGKAVYLNFFTQWCPYCMQELPDIKKIFETYSPEELQIVLVHVWDGENESNSHSIRQKYGLEDMTFFEDEDQSLSAIVGLQGYPLSLLIDKDGTLYNYAAGMLNYDRLASMMDAMTVAKKDGAL